VALMAATLWVYAPVRHFDFVEIDDPAYVSENPHIASGLTGEAVTWAFTRMHAAYWLPLTWISYMADVEIYGSVRAGGHHVTNVVLHVANTLLLFILLLATTRARGPSAFVAALFALHPLHVESVAWITERKDVLSTFFWMLTLLAYVWYTRRPGWRRYAAVAVGAVLGLMAKPMLVTLPFLLLLLDVWPLARVRLSRDDGWPAWKPLLVEKVPLLLLAVAAAVVTFWAQQAGGATPPLAAIPLGLRLENAVVSYVAYLRQTVWPAGLTVFYPYPPSIPAYFVAGALAVLLAITVAVLLAARRRPYLMVGWFWYLGTLVPAIGFVQAGIQARADRFTYVPLIGVFIMAAWGARELAARSRAWRLTLATLGIVVVSASAVGARNQLGVWHDSVTLWTRAMECTLEVGEYDAHVGLGRVLMQQGRLQEALGHFTDAVRLRPDSAESQHSLGLVLLRLNRPDEAIEHFKVAVRIKPDLAEAHAGLGVALSRVGRNSEAIAEYEQAARLQPGLVEVHNNLGALLAGQGRLDEAIAQFDEAVRLNPDFEGARMNLGLALANAGRLEEALRQFQAVLARNPQQALARRAVEQLSRR
jgi:Tfp pilus assembly protein PilF